MYRIVKGEEFVDLSSSNISRKSDGYVNKPLIRGKAVFVAKSVFTNLAAELQTAEARNKT